MKNNITVCRITGTFYIASTNQTSISIKFKEFERNYLIIMVLTRQQNLAHQICLIIIVINTQTTLHACMHLYMNISQRYKLTKSHYATLESFLTESFLKDNKREQNCEKKKITRNEKHLTLIDTGYIQLTIQYKKLNFTVDI